MRGLGVNIDHVATLRQVRGSHYPEVIIAAGICEQAGADSITVHLREDRRHIQDRDVRILKDTLDTRLNLEMATTEEITKIAIGVKPYMCTLVPEKREELTTEGGLSLLDSTDSIQRCAHTLMEKGILVSLFIDPDLDMIKKAYQLGVPFIEIHTGTYCNSALEKDQQRESHRIHQAAAFAEHLGLRVNAGHGLNYHNILPIAAIPMIEEFNIGHSIIARAVFVGLHQAVREMKSLVLASS